MNFASEKPLVFIATVKSTKDPMGLGRIQVELKDLDKPVEMPWIRMIHFHASKEVGAMILPEVGDMVAVLRGASDRIGSMFILGFIYDKTNKPAVKDEDGKNNIKQFQTRSKHIVEFSDEKGKEKISVTTGKGASIVMDDELEKITLTVMGLSIDMDGKEKKITIKSDGDLIIDAKTIDVKGADGISMAGKEFKVKTDAALELKAGAAGKFETGAALDLKGGAPVNIKGPAVNIG
jgi:uncharacterized protein involved in type VI secretion and phage assembly